MLEGIPALDGCPMRDGPLRRAVKAVARSFYLVDLRLSRVLLRARGEPSFDLGGVCRLCAKCCEAPAIRVRPLWVRLRSTRWLIARWHRLVNGFELIEVHPRQGLLVFRCTHFDSATRRCDSYDSRPGMCRDYPRNLLYHPRPGFLPGCGYFALNRNRDRLRELLDRERIPPEKRAAIDAVFCLNEAPPTADPGSPTPGES